MFIPTLRRDYCSICDERRRFDPFGNPRRARARCPGCGSLERHRALWSWLEPHLRPGMRILHSSPESALYERLRARSELVYVTTELHPEAHAQDPNLVQADLEDLPFEPGSFDLVVCSHVLEHVPDDRRAMREIRRVLDVGGTAVIQVPIADRDTTYEAVEITSPAARRSAFGQEDHVRLYGRDFGDRLRAVGFDVMVVPAAHPGSHVHLARPDAMALV